MLRLTVIIPTHNPRADYLERTIAALRTQTLPVAEWELLLVDNGSVPPVDPAFVDWHPNGRVEREETLGLTPARLHGLAAARSDLLIWVDDDNALAATYLETAATLFNRHPDLGAAGGKATAEYESPPPAWYTPHLAPIGCRDLGDGEIWAHWANGGIRAYPDAAPIGAGMIIRREAMRTWAEFVTHDPLRRQLGRTGQSLSSGEDNDINLTLLNAGWKLAYVPILQLQHLIPPRRLTLEYQQRIAYATFRDFVTVLRLHNVSPWPAIPRWTVPLRKLKAWFTCRAWSGPVARIRWAGICGHYDGRAGRASDVSAK